MHFGTRNMIILCGILFATTGQPEVSWPGILPWVGPWVLLLWRSERVGKFYQWKAHVWLNYIVALLSVWMPVLSLIWCCCVVCDSIATVVWNFVMTYCSVVLDIFMKLWESASERVQSSCMKQLMEPKRWEECSAGGGGHLWDFALTNMYNL